MSDRPIQKGDLVIVVSGHECYLGGTYTVLAPNGGKWSGMECAACKKVTKYKGVQSFVRGIGRDGHLPISWLKRIPPLGELEDTPTQERIEA